jgi:single-stranded-DNA-specific exonuclease
MELTRIAADSHATHFLGVRRSVSGRAWVSRCSDQRLALAVAQQAGLPELLGRVLAARGVTPEEAAAWLDPRLRTLMPHPARFRDMEKGAGRLAAAIMAGEAVGIIGDYDVDGTCAAAMMSEFLGCAGLHPRVHIPHRVSEGYGPSVQAVEEMARAGTRVLITLDCGAMAHEVLEHAAGLGLETIVVDHHQMGTSLPRAHAVINPNRPDDDSGQGHLCAAGVAFVLMAAVARRLEEAGFWQARGGFRPDLLQWLDLVALATVCDVVPLRGVNRAYVRQGLRVMAKRARPGLAALADVARLRRAPDVHALGFVLGPRINAAGRIGHAREALRLLTTRRLDEAQALAARLESLNRTRQDMETRFLEEAEAQANALLDRHGRVPLVVQGDEWHPGVVGLVAARLKERFGLPAVAFAGPAAGQANDGAGTAVLTGSARSVAGVDIGRAVARAVAAGILERGGGHAMAAGMSCRQDRLEAFREWLAEDLALEIAALPEQPELKVDAALTAAGATAELVEMLERAGPYGAGNPAPVLALPAHVVEWADIVGDAHVRCSLRAGDGSRLRAIAFRAKGTPLADLLLERQGRPLHVACRLAIDTFNGGRQAQALIVDAASAGK